MSAPGMQQVFLSAHRPMLALAADPAPGSVPGLRSMVRQLWRTTEDASGVSVNLFGPAAMTWSGRTAELVVPHLQALTSRSEELTCSLEDAATALSTWADRLQQLQDDADALDREALAAQQVLQRAEQALAVAAYRASPATAVDPLARRAVVYAEADLDAITIRAAALADDYARDAWAHARRIDEAGTALALRGTAGLATAWDTVSDVNGLMVRGLAPILDTTADAATLAASVADVASIGFAIGGGPLAVVAVPVAEALSVGLSLSATRDRVLLASFAGGSWTDAGIEGAAVVGGVGVRAAGGVATATTRRSTSDLDGPGPDTPALDTIELLSAALPGGSDAGGGSWAVQERTTEGTGVVLRAHDVEDPWDVGPGYAAAAVLPATVPRPTGTGSPTGGRVRPAAGRPPGSSSAPENHPPARG